MSDSVLCYILHLCICLSDVNCLKKLLNFYLYWSILDTEGLGLWLWAGHCCKMLCFVKYWIFTCPAKEAAHNIFCLKCIKDVMTCKCFRIILVSFCLLIELRMGGLNFVEVVCLPPTTTVYSFTFCFHNACILRGMLH